MSHETIIPYVGGKQKAVRQLVSFFPDDLVSMGAPFIGGGSVEVFMQAKGVRVFGGDLCRELAVFWQEMLTRPVAVAEAFKARLPIEYPLDGYRAELRELSRRSACPKGNSIPERASPGALDTAVLFYILIECGFSHILARTGGAPRQTRNLNRKAWRSRYAKLRRFEAVNLSVEHLDCFAFLERYPGVFLYCDPPYANSENLYGFSEDLHGRFEHARWAEALRSDGRPFVSSYGDCELVRDLYSGWCDIHSLAWYYGCKQGSQIGEELVIVRK